MPIDDEPQEEPIEEQPTEQPLESGATDQPFTPDHPSAKKFNLPKEAVTWIPAPWNKKKRRADDGDTEDRQPESEGGASQPDS